MTNVFNKKELIGQKVNDGRSNGVITELLQHTAYPVAVKFETGREATFTEDGYIIREDAFPCLRFGHLNSNDEIDYGEPEWTADWDNHNQHKFFIKYNHRKAKWDIDCNTFIQLAGIEYMSGKEAEKLAKYKNENGIKP